MDDVDSCRLSVCLCMDCSIFGWFAVNYVCRMGYFLIFESMLNTVLRARDKWLKPGGFMFPDKAFVYAAGIEDASYKQENFGFWSDIYGFNMEPMKQLALLEPVIDTISVDQIMTKTEKVMEWDLNTISLEQLDRIELRFSLEASVKDRLHAAVFWFDVSFPSDTPPGLVLTTSPFCEATHWKHVVFYVGGDEGLELDAKSKADVHMVIAPNKRNSRDLDIAIACMTRNKQGEITYNKSVSYRLR